MPASFKPRRIMLAAAVTVFLPSMIFPQSDSSSQGSILLEFVYTACVSDCDRSTTRVYADGRYISDYGGDELTKSGRRRRVSIREEKKLEAEELAELVKWAEETEFLNAMPQYVVKVTQDSSACITISYRNRDRHKKVEVCNFNAGNAAEKARVPAPVMKLAKWAEPYLFPE